MEQLMHILSSCIWGMDDDTPDGVLHAKMLKNGKTLSIAESCTGGLLQEMLTSHPGASVYFPGGIVSYSNSVKEEFLDVSAAILQKQGAVSQEVAVAMALGVKNKFATNLAAAITGIAGPDGGTKEKPVGTVYLSVTDGFKTKTELACFNGDRQSIRLKAAEKCIFMLLDLIDSRE
jgi:nicotinamide-nucleotide amidase